MDRLAYLSALIARIGLIAAVNQAFAQVPVDLVSPSATLQLVRGGLDMTEGPASDSSGTVFFTEPFSNTLWRVDTSGTVSLLRGDTQGANGVVFDSQDRMILCEIGRVARFESDSSLLPLAMFAGRANDLSLCADGGLFFTEPDWDIPANGDVWYLPPGGPARTVLSAEVGFPNGVEYVEERHRLYVAVSRQNVIRSYPVDNGMNLGQPDTFVTVAAPDGFAIDERGNFWVAGNSTAIVFVYDSTGAALGQVPITPQSSITNCAFGGPGHDILFITGGNAVYKLQTLVRGRSTTGAVTVVEPRRGLHQGASPEGQQTARTVLLDGRMVRQPRCMPGARECARHVTQFR